MSVKDDEKHTKSELDFVAIENSEKFKRFMSRKKKFIIPYTVFFLIFYFALPILTSYTTFLNTPAFASISWVWIFAFAQFIMTFVICTIYVSRANKFDKQADEILEEHTKKGRKVS